MKLFYSLNLNIFVPSFICKYLLLILMHEIILFSSVFRLKIEGFCTKKHEYIFVVRNVNKFTE